jgi:hypothetical protein
MSTVRTVPAAVLAVLASAAHAADGPIPVRRIAPDSSYALVSADDFAKTVTKWKATPLHAFVTGEQMSKLLGEDGGAQDAMSKRLSEMGVPEGSFSWPVAFGVALFTVHDEELDAEESHTFFYGDWGAGADGMAKVFDAFIDEAIRKDGVTVEKEDVAGREVRSFKLPDAPKQAPGGGMDLQVDFSVNRPFERVHFCRDGTRFIACTDLGALEDALEAIDGKRTAKLPDQADFRGAMDQLGETDISVAILTGPMQKSFTGEGAGMLALLTPVMQPLFGDVQAWTIGIGVGTTLGQVELTSGIYVPGEKVGAWSLLGPAAPIGAPPPMIGPDATGLGRVNVRFPKVMEVINAAMASLPQDQADQIDAMLLELGPMMTKGFEALGPGVWTYETVRQPLTPESRVSSTVVSCSNPKSVYEFVEQMGGSMGLEPRDFDGNTIFGSEFMPFAVGIANGWMATGDSKLVEQSMRAIGQKDLPSVADSPAYKAAALAVGGEPVIAWGYIDTAARWELERQLMEQFGEDDSRLDNVVGRADDSSYAKRFGYKLPDESGEILKKIDGAMVARHMGPMAWSMRADARGFVTRAALMQPSAAPEPAKDPAKK